MENDIYAGFADRYDLFFGKFGEFDPSKRQFFNQLFADNGITTVLDCACGTGHDLILFNSLGCQASGSDISESMLSQARKNLAAYGLEIPLIKADYRELPQHFKSDLDAVVCLATAISEMPNEAEVLKAFKSMYQVLNEGGILVLTQSTTDKQWTEKPRFLPMINNPDFSRVCVIDYFETGARYNILDIFHSKDKTDFKTWSIDYKQILLRDDFERLLKKSGFKTIDLYGDFSFGPYSKESSSKLIVVARK
jgi:glycine/sarcosine N-methyltransferase